MALTSFWSGVPVNETCAPWDYDSGSPVAGGDLVPVKPVRVLDTRTGTGLDAPCRVGAPPSWRGGTTSLVLDVTGKGDVPDTGVAAVALRVTTWSSSAPLPTLRLRSTAKNSPVPAVTAPSTGQYGSTVVVPVAADGTVRLSLDRGTAEARVEVVAWAPPLAPSIAGASAAVSASGPTRLVSPTTVVDGTQAPLEPGETRTLDLSGLGGVPDADLRGVAVTVLTAKAGTTGLVNVYSPASSYLVGQVRVSSTLQRSAPMIVPTTDGRIVVKNASKVPVAVSVKLQGWFAAASISGGARTRMLAQPVTVVDSAQGIGFAGPLPKAGTRVIKVVGKATVPVGARAVLLSVTATGGSSSGTLTVIGSGQVPAVAFTARRAAHELVLLPLTSTGNVSFSTRASGAQVRAAVVGWAA